MHEVGLMAEALRRAAQTAEQVGAQRIERLTFAIAPGGHVTPEAVQTLFGLMSPGTPAEGAELAVEWQEIPQHCWECGTPYLSTKTQATCPSCGQAGTPTTAAPELVLRSIDVSQS
ncbi:MAG: hydrogenase maturation nickel metallochaperone HypA [Chloroflexi bacterium]|nr:hydrogenase maturation nickel metallochaperone HypA [Chloroflexota bacterium]